MGININKKGSTGEREVASKLNEVVDRVRIEYGLPSIPIEDMPFQRNQLQSAIGGDDLTNPFGLSIEVKRKEQLSINAWWQQCVKSSQRFNTIPILIFKQNRKKWRIIMLVNIELEQWTPNTKISPPCLTTRAEIDIDSFLKWFANFYSLNLEKNGIRKPTL